MDIFKRIKKSVEIPYFLQKRIEFREADSRPRAEVRKSQGYRQTVDTGISLFSPEYIEQYMTWDKVRAIGSGLANLGNTCFLNSVLQCLMYCPPLANFLLSQQHSRNCSNSSSFCFLCVFEKLIVECQGKKVVYPKQIVGNMKAIAKHFKFGRQEDSHEFMRFVIEAMQKSCLFGKDRKKDHSLTHTTLVHQIFGGLLKSTIVCSKCQAESSTEETFLDLSLDIKGCNSVERAISKFIEPETLSKSNRYKCGRCHQLVEADKKYSVERLPNVLTIQLKRFDFGGQKLGKHVSFSQTLKMNANQMCENYKLFAVLVHSGHSTRSGHYYAFVLGSNSSWYCVNDSSVQQVSLHTVLSQNAYILFYLKESKEKKKKKSSSQEELKAAVKNSDGERRGNSVKRNDSDSEIAPDLVEVDVESLSSDEVVKGVNGNEWNVISIKNTKEWPSHVPKSGSRPILKSEKIHATEKRKQTLQYEQIQPVGKNLNNKLRKYDEEYDLGKLKKKKLKKIKAYQNRFQQFQNMQRK